MLLKQFNFIFILFLSVAFIACEGPQGDQGEPGPQGEQGAQGDPGADGADGTDGLNGADGQDGVDGQDGNANVWSEDFSVEYSEWLYEASSNEYIKTFIPSNGEISSKDMVNVYRLWNEDATRTWWRLLPFTHNGESYGFDIYEPDDTNPNSLRMYQTFEEVSGTVTFRLVVVNNTSNGRVMDIDWSNYEEVSETFGLD